MRAALAAVLLAGCTDWSRLECDVRLSCDAGREDDAGFLEPLPMELVVGAISDPSAAPIVGFARGTQGYRLATSAGVFSEDGGFEPVAAAVVALDAAGTPARYWLAQSDGHVHAYDEATGTGFDPATPTAFSPLSVSTYVEHDGGIAGVVFFSVPELHNQGYLDDAIGEGAVDCRVPAPQSASVGMHLVAVAVGATTECTEASGFVGYVAAFFPRDGANFVARLQADPNPGRVRIGSNGELGIAVMETAEGITAARLSGAGLTGAVALAVRIDADGGTHGLLDDVEQLTAGDEFVMALTNRRTEPLRLSSPDGGGGALLFPRQTALLGVRWMGQAPTPVAAWSVQLGAPDDLHLDADPMNTDVWLAATCDGASGPCASWPAGKVVFRLPAF